jgi:hypothetical protein
MRRSSLVRPEGGPPARSARWRRTFVLASTAVLALSGTALPAQGQPEPEPSPSASSAPAAKSTDAADAASPEARQALAAAKAATAEDGTKVLVFHGPADEQDDPVAAAVAAIQELGAENGIGVDVSSDPASFSAQTLAAYRGVVFLSAMGTELSPSQEDALEAFIE